MSKEALSHLLRAAARDYLGLNEGDYWPSGVADAQAKALMDAGWITDESDQQEDA